LSISLLLVAAVVEVVCKTNEAAAVVPAGFCLVQLPLHPDCYPLLLDLAALVALEFPPWALEATDPPAVIVPFLD
jgi:hypothetical protein